MLIAAVQATDREIAREHRAPRALPRRDGAAGQRDAHGHAHKTPTCSPRRADVPTSTQEAVGFARVFVSTPFSGEPRHARRLAMIADYEKTGELPPLTAS